MTFRLHTFLMGLLALIAAALLALAPVSANPTSEGYVDEITYKPVDSIGVRDARQTAVGKEGIAGDVGGHIQACRHGGTCDRFNLFPQNSNFNNSAYKRWENEITRALQNGDDVGNVTVRLNRADPYNPRPDSIEIEYQINGRTFTRDFENQAGGGQ
ncbi:DNA/RNA non-specific endonuclease [Pannonibacter sp. Q-1]